MATLCPKNCEDVKLKKGCKTGCTSTWKISENLYDNKMGKRCQVLVETNSCLLINQIKRMINVINRRIP